MLFAFRCCGYIRDFYSGVIKGELFYNTCHITMDVCIKIVEFPLQNFVFMDANLTSTCNYFYCLTFHYGFT